MEPWMWVNKDREKRYFKKQKNSKIWQDIDDKVSIDTLTEISFGINEDEKLFVILFSTRLNYTLKLSPHKCCYWTTYTRCIDYPLFEGYWAKNLGKNKENFFSNFS